MEKIEEVFLNIWQMTKKQEDEEENKEIKEKIKRNKKMIKMIEKMIKDSKEKWEEKIEEIKEFERREEVREVLEYIRRKIKEWEDEKEGKEEIEMRFELRDNQKRAIERTIESRYKSGIHHQIMGAGKSYIMLKIIDEHRKEKEEKKERKLYIIMTDRKDILRNYYYERDGDKYKIRDKLKEELRERRIIELEDYEIVDGINEDYESKELLVGKKSKILIVNNDYMKSGKRYKKIKEEIGLIMVDECHSVSGKMNYEMLKYFREMNISVIGFSATPLRPIKRAETYIKEVYGDGERVNIISNYSMIEALKDGVILPFRHTIIEGRMEKMSNKNIEREYMRNIIMEYYIKNELPYRKGVIWVNRIDKIDERIEGNYINNIKEMDEIKDKIKIYSSHSRDEEDKIGEFMREKENSLIFCVNRMKEGTDIDNLDVAFFMDAVKKRSIVVSMQSIGRVMRPDRAGKKKYAEIVECVKIDEEMNVELVTVKTILNYYKKILNISKLSDDCEYIDEIIKLYTDTEIIEREENKRIKIKIEKGVEIEIRIDCKKVDWLKFKNNLYETLEKKIKNSEKIKEKEYEKLREKVRILKMEHKDKYIKWAEEEGEEIKPEDKYKNFWDKKTGWYNFLGVDVSRYPKNVDEMRKRCKKYKIRNINEYYRRMNEYEDLPKMPNEIIKNMSSVFMEDEFI